MTMWKIKRFIYRIKRVIEFIPVIWKGYDWDYGSAIDVFQYQLTRTADYLESDKAQTLAAKTNAAKIWTAVELMEKVYDEDYAMEYMDDIERFIYRVKRVIEFIPVIWKGYDWDYGSAIDVFQYQLTRTADYLESDKARSLDAKTNAAKIWTAIELMEKVYNEDYAMEYMDDIERLYGKSKHEFVELDEKKPKHLSLIHI